jgi:hypothetical protein
MVTFVSKGGPTLIELGRCHNKQDHVYSFKGVDPFSALRPLASDINRVDPHRSTLELDFSDPSRFHATPQDLFVGRDIVGSGDFLEVCEKVGCGVVELKEVRLTKDHLQTRRIAHAQKGISQARSQTAALVEYIKLRVQVQENPSSAGKLVWKVNAEKGIGFHTSLRLSAV